MAYKEVLRVEVQEVIRRWQAGGGQRQIGVGTGLSRVTVRKYLATAMAAGLEQDGPPPDEVQLSRLAGISRAGPKRVETPVEDSLVPLGRPDLPVAQRRPSAGDPHPRVAGGAGLCGVVYVAAALHSETQLEQAQQDHGAHGGHSPRRGGGDGLRPPGVGP